MLVLLPWSGEQTVVCRSAARNILVLVPMHGRKFQPFIADCTPVTETKTTINRKNQFLSTGHTFSCIVGKYHIAVGSDTGCL